MAERHVVMGSNAWKQHWLIVALLVVGALAGCAMPLPAEPVAPAQTSVADATATEASRIIGAALGTATQLHTLPVVDDVGPQASIAPTVTVTPSPSPLPSATPTALPTRTPTPTPTASPTATPYPLLYEHIWTVRATDADDVSALFVNGKMVGAAMRDGPVPDIGWVTINRELEPALDNIVTFASSNRGGDFSWRFDLRQDETAVWTAEQKGKGDVNLLQYVQQVVVAPDGSVVAASPPDAIRRAAGPLVCAHGKCR
jgi:hypothetical protein